MQNLPAPPHITITEKSAQILPETGFIKIKRSEILFHYPDGTTSKPFTADRSFKGTDDAVGILAWFKKNGLPYIYLRSAIRPPLSLRDYSSTGLPEVQDIGNLWEIPAGGIEKTELGYDGIFSAAARESEEEIGFTLSPKDFKFLGKRIFIDPGSSGTRMFLVHCEVDPKNHTEPSTDGGPMEAYGQLLSISLKDALQAVKDGYIIDTYTEIGIRRLVDLLDV